MNWPRYVYIAGPYTRPNPNHNVHATIKVADEVLAMGFIPYVPHLSHFWDTMSPHHYEDWMQLDFAWIARCDVLIRLPGESSGADREVEHAKRLEIPVFYGLEAFQRFIDAQRMSGEDRRS
jgi:nucleoside 2-deoxyribosyltransferase